jgi:hypothetical protein
MKNNYFKMRTGIGITTGKQFPKDFELSQFELEADSLKVLAERLVFQLSAAFARVENPEIYPSNIQETYNKVIDYLQTTKKRLK